MHIVLLLRISTVDSIVPPDEFTLNGMLTLCETAPEVALFAGFVVNDSDALERDQPVGDHTIEVG